MNLQNQHMKQLILIRMTSCRNVIIWKRSTFLIIHLQIFFTSGTTGKPKMVPHTHSSYGYCHYPTGKYWLDLSKEDLMWNISDTGNRRRKLPILFLILFSLVGESLLGPQYLDHGLRAQLCSFTACLGSPPPRSWTPWQSTLSACCVRPLLYTGHSSRKIWRSGSLETWGIACQEVDK